MFPVVVRASSYSGREVLPSVIGPNAEVANKIWSSSKLPTGKIHIIMLMFIHIILGRYLVKTIQMTLDESLLQQVDQVVRELQTTRSAFIREALEGALQAYRIRRLEEQDEAGYQAIPVELTEVVEWATEQVWGDAWNEEK